MDDLQNGAPLLIYGARLAGQSVHAYLLKRGIHVNGFLDQDESLDQVHGIDVTCARRWAASNDAAGACVIIGLFNNYVDVGQVVRDLQQLGYGRVLSLVEFVNRYPDDQPFRYWLVEGRFYIRHADRIARMRSHLADDQSKTVLDSIVKFRTSGDYLGLPAPTPRQYFPEDLPRWPSPLRFIDCGAYTGDTVQEMRGAGLEIETLACFEPNLEYYAQLASNVVGLPAINFPCGVSNHNRRVGFDPALGAGGHLVEKGEQMVTCVSIDDALPGFAPNLIKMDIEGEEPAALEGALRTLQHHRPNLAISVYHRAEHLWSIFEQVLSYDLNYRFYLRCHAHSTFDTVLYALSDGGENHEPDA